jgi:linoleoyl-CoA desaturase
LFVFNWLLVPDFRDFFDSKRMVRKIVDIPRVEYAKLFFFKAIFIAYTLVIPVLFFQVSWMRAVSALIILMLAASIIALMVLLPPHANIYSDFPLPDDKGRIDESWLRHQLLTTNDVEEDNWFTRLFMGCFNYHIAHHLFPNISHVFYPDITPIIEKFARQNGLPYRKFTLLHSLESHYRLLKQNAYSENMFEETM